MTKRLPKPPIPANVDIRDFHFMPLDVVQLQNSESWSMAKLVPGASRAMMNLWMRAWHQVPAGSLPDNDAVLASWADVADWQNVRELTLRGFKKCSDKRLYHPVICKKAMEAFERKEDAAERREVERQRKKDMRERKAQRKQASRPVGQGRDVRRTSAGQTPDVPWDKAGTSHGTTPDASAVCPPDVRSMTGTGTYKGQGEGGTPPLPPPPKPPSRNGTDPPMPDAVAGPLPAFLDRRVETAALAAWDAMAEATGRKPLSRPLADDRRKALRARLTECGGIEGWEHAVAKIRGSPFLNGQRGERKWLADFDFLMDEKHFRKLMEGGYDDAPESPETGGRSDAAEAVARILGSRAGPGAAS